MHFLALREGNEVAPVVEHLSRGGLEQTDEIFHQYGLARSTLSDNEIRLARFENGVDALEYGLVVERLGELPDFNHFFLGVRRSEGVKGSEDICRRSEEE